MTLFDPDELGPPPTDPQRYRMTVAYDGTGFHGFAVNPGVATIGGTLTTALERVLRHPVELTCAGRTDRGVHARGQVVDFVSTPHVDAGALTRALNHLCAPAIAVRDLEPVDMEFSARFDATSRRYRYTILNRATPDPLMRHASWHVEHPLDLAVLRLACDPLLGEHDFTSFCRRPKTAAGDDVSLVRRVTDACWEPEPDGILHFWIEATSFCHQMVRSIVGTLVEVGLGKRSAGELRSVLAARDRSMAGQVAPPHGLTLWQVRY